MPTRLWRLSPPAPQSFLAANAHLPPLIAQLLYNRGLRDRAPIDAFFRADRSLAGDPFALPDMERAVGRVYQAILAGDAIAVFGDFDVDGVTASAVLTLGLRSLGAKVLPYIPSRVAEGHGLNQPALIYLLGAGARLLVTADCGISSGPEVRLAAQAGLDTIIVDHHTPPQDVPPALARINPRQAGASYPYGDLASVGLALKLIEALCVRLHRSDFESLYDLAALGTVADIAPIVGENRYIVRRGLDLLNKLQRPGLQALAQIAGLRPGSIDAEAISFALGPRLNAPGRLNHAVSSFKLLTTDSPEEASHLAGELERQNQQRRRLTEAVLGEARPQIEDLASHPILVVSGERFSPGVIGPVASKLVEEFYRPAVVIEEGPELARGSARSIPEFNVIAALKECSDLFLRYGGHPQAGGFTTPIERLSELRARLHASAERQLAGVDLTPSIAIDAAVPLRHLTPSVLPWLLKLAPHGAGNPEPVFLASATQVTSARYLGTGEKHIRLKLKDGSVTWDAVGFNLGAWLPKLQPRMDVLYTVGVDSFRGQGLLQLRVLDLAASQGRPAP